MLRLGPVQRHTMVNVNIRAGGRVIQPVVGAVHRAIHLAGMRGQSDNPAAALTARMHRQQSRDLFCLRIHPPQILGAAGREVGRGDAIDRCAVGGQQGRPRPRGEIGVAPQFAASKIALNQCDPALGARCAQVDPRAARRDRAHAGVISQPAAGAAGAVEPGRIVRGVGFDVRVWRHLVTQLQRRVPERFPGKHSGRHVMAGLIFQIPRHRRRALRTGRTSHEIPDPPAGRVFHHHRDFAVCGDRERDAEGRRIRHLHHLGNRPVGEVGEHLKPADLRFRGRRGAEDFHAQSARLHGWKKQQMASRRSPLGKLRQGGPLALRRDGGIHAWGTLVGGQLKFLKIIHEQQPAETLRFFPRQREPRGRHVTDRRSMDVLVFARSAVLPIAGSLGDMAGILCEGGTHIRIYRKLAFSIGDGRRGQVVPALPEQSPQTDFRPSVSPRLRAQQRPGLEFRRERQHLTARLMRWYCHCRPLAGHGRISSPGHIGLETRHRQWPGAANQH